MIYHKERNYLFVHIQKTAGTSVSAYLTKHFGAQFVSPAHAQLRCLTFSGPPPFIFAVVRNPWQRLVSWYEMMRAKGPHNDFSRYLLEVDARGAMPSFSDFLRRTEIIRESASPECIWSGGTEFGFDQSKGYLKSIAFNQIDYLTDSYGNARYDRIIKFNSLAEDFYSLMAKLHPGKHLPILPRINSRPMLRHWRSYYNSVEDREWVAKLYIRDIAHFGFSLED